MSSLTGASSSSDSSQQKQQQQHQQKQADAVIIELKKRPLSSSSANSAPRKRFGDDSASREGDGPRRGSALDDKNTQSASSLSTMEEARDELPPRIDDDDDDQIIDVDDDDVAADAESPFLHSSVIVFDKTDFDDILKSLTPEKEVDVRRRSASARFSRYVDNDVDVDIGIGDDDARRRRRQRRRNQSHDGALRRNPLEEMTRTTTKRKTPSGDDVRRSLTGSVVDMEQESVDESQNETQDFGECMCPQAFFRFTLFGLLLSAEVRKKS